MLVISRDERRKESRRPVALKLDVTLTHWVQLERLYTTDLSQGGLQFLSDRDVVVGARLRVVLHLPDAAGPLSLPATVRHVARGIDGFYRVGVAFDDLPSVSAAVLNTFLDHLSGDDP